MTNAIIAPIGGCSMRQRKMPIGAKLFISFSGLIQPSNLIAHAWSMTPILPVRGG